MSERHKLSSKDNERCWTKHPRLNYLSLCQQLLFSVFKETDFHPPVSCVIFFDLISPLFYHQVCQLRCVMSYIPISCFLTNWLCVRSSGVIVGDLFCTAFCNETLICERFISERTWDKASRLAVLIVSKWGANVTVRFEAVFRYFFVRVSITWCTCNALISRENWLITSKDTKCWRDRTSHAMRLCSVDLILEALCMQTKNKKHHNHFCSKDKRNDKSVNS